MVISSTRQTDISIHAVSPLLGGVTAAGAAAASAGAASATTAGAAGAASAGAGAVAAGAGAGAGAGSSAQRAGPQPMASAARRVRRGRIIDIGPLLWVEARCESIPWQAAGPSWP